MPEQEIDASGTPPTRFKKSLRLVLWLVLALVLLFPALILTIVGSGTELPGWIIVAGVVWMIGVRRRWRWAAVPALAAVLLVIFVRAGVEPSNDRTWQEHLTVMPEVRIDGGVITIEGVRNFRWNADETYDAAWETRTYELTNLQGVDLIVEPFSATSLLAHTMLSFDFGPDGRVILTIEARKEPGEVYGIVDGGLNRFEMLYIFADERDALGVRYHRGHQLYAYPATVEPVALRAFFLGLATTANNLRTRPAFYKIVRDNCTTAWVRHSDALSTRPMGLNLDTIFNARVGRLLYERGSIPTDLPYEQIKARHRIDPRIPAAIDDPDFSDRIREGQNPAQAEP